MEHEEQLIERVKNNRDMNAYGILIDRYQSNLRLFIYRLTNNWDLTDDISQDTFIKAFDNLDKYSHRNSFQNWLMKIAHNLVRSEYRSINTVKKVFAKLFAEPSYQENWIGLTGSEQNRLNQALQSLQLGERTAVVLNFSYDMSHQDIANWLGLPLGTVKSHIKRGMEKLRHNLGVDIGGQ